MKDLICSGCDEFMTCGDYYDYGKCEECYEAEKTKSGAIIAVCSALVLIVLLGFSVGLGIAAFN